jgi:hypothetical protein
MLFQHAGSIRYLEFDLLEKAGLFHAVITRHEGVSPVPWSSLNLGGSGGDERSRVNENRMRVFQAFQIDNNRVHDVWQVHGDTVVCANGPREAGAPHQKADAILTNVPNTFLLMLFADCVPILLFDPMQKVAGIAHAGWKGTVLKIAQRAVEQMIIRYGSQPQNILAAVGPSIGPDHYIVGKDVIGEVEDVFGVAAEDFFQNHNGAVKFNLWECNRYILELAGIKHIEVAEICTACHVDDWFSHRAEQGRTGRFGVIIGLRA